jgi:hypothetical protein
MRWNGPVASGSIATYPARTPVENVFAVMFREFCAFCVERRSVWRRR